MAVTADRTRPRADPGASHPFHAFALSGAFVLFLGALLGDYAYWSSHQIQWSNFASWLLVGGMVLASIAVLCEVFALFVGGRSWLRVLVVAATWVVGFFDALHHGRDAWAIMPGALWMSLLATLLALVATWLSFASLPYAYARAGGAR
jgi:uncharacterized membrane protein